MAPAGGVDLHEALVASIPHQAEIAQLYAQAGGDPSVLNSAQATRYLWAEALNLLAQQEALRRLCEEVLPGIRRLQSAPRFQAALKAVIDAPPGDQRKLIAQVGMVDSLPLRDLVDMLKADPVLRVLLVRDRRKTVQARPRDMFIAGAREQGALAIYLFEPVVATVDDVVCELFHALGAGDRIPPRNTTSAAWFATVCRTLAGVVSETERPLWIAVDDVGAVADDGAPLLDPEITAFWDHFVLQMASPAFGKWFRLLLIHWPEGPVPTRWLQEVWREYRLTDAEVGLQDIVDYLREWARAQDGVVFSLGEIERLAADVIEKVDSPTPEQAHVPRLRRLYDELAGIQAAHRDPRSR
jgi:hypothetical protein